MRFPGQSSPWYCKLIATTLVLIVYLNLIGLSDAIDGAGSRARELDDDIRYWEDEERDKTHILSRKRRYLTFPSGSSFQLVYDLIIGMVDYTNYLIFGVTSAIAWQLPSDPPSAIVDTLRTRLQDGTLGTSRNDTIENIQYVDTKPKQPAYIPSLYSTTFTRNVIHPPMHTKYYTSKPEYYSAKPEYYQQPEKSFSEKADSNYYSVRQNPLTDWKQGTIREFPSSYKPSSPPSAVSDLMSKWSHWWNGGKKKDSRESPQTPKHRIYPVFAKRSARNRQKRHGIIGTTLTEEDKIHLRYHRSSRQDFYMKIEKYLEYHKKNGHQCVLKALCETGQKGTEDEPGTFVGEIMRAVFTMPESDDPVHNHVHKRYDEAHEGAEDCVQKYPLCPDSLWKADFIL